MSRKFLSVFCQFGKTFSSNSLSLAPRRNVWTCSNQIGPSLRSVLGKECRRSNTFCQGVVKYSTEAPQDKPSLFQKFKTLYRDYWYVLVPVHLVTSAGWFAGFYYLAESGVDLADIAEKLNMSDSIVDKLREGSASKTTGYLAIAYLLYKIATPLRYTVTLGGTTVTINYLKKWGYIKSTKELKKIITDKKNIYDERRRERRKIASTSFLPKFSEKKS